MRKIVLIITFVLTLTTHIFAQSSMVQKAGKTVFSLTTFKPDGTILATSHGVFCGDEGEAISSFTPFIGAKSAVIIDASGRKSEVESIIGANEIYDICRFKVTNAVSPITVAEKEATGKVFAVSYSTKRPSAKALTVKTSEKFLDKYNYYVFNEEISDEFEGCPIVNESGMLIGLVQRSKASYDIISTDSRYYSQLATTGLSSHDQVFRKTGIRATLPKDHDQARLMLMMINADTDSLNAVNSIKDYQKIYPTDIDSYSAMARFQLSRGNIESATMAMEDAIKNLPNKDEAYSEYAKQIYGVATVLPDSIENKWTFDLAEEQINKAIQINNSPAYQHQLAQIIYAKGDYQKAYSLFEAVANGGMSTSEVYYEMAQCKSHLGAENKDILPLLDKAVEQGPKPITRITAPYIYARGLIYDDMGEYKKALQDYNLYDTLMVFQASHDFYYTRFKCELQIRQYQQALNDIAHAVYLNPSEMTYLAEMASLQLRVGQYENAIKTCELSLRMTDQYADIYIIQGVALIKQNRKDEAMTAFRKAADLGDTRGNEYIEKYK